MDLQKLIYFITIVKHRNLTRAAQELYISQPTLTKFLQKLENELGGRLFLRTGHNYDLTFLGQRYLEYAQKMLTLHQDWKKELLDMQSSYEGELNISMPPMRSVCIFPRILPEFQKMHPGVHINIYEHDHSIQEALLENSKLDFAIFNYWKALTGLCYEFLAREEILLILPPLHPLISHAVPRPGSAYPWLDLSLFGDVPFILHFPDQNTGRSARQLFEQYHIQPPVYLQSRNSQLCIQLAASGAGACFAPETYVHYARDLWPIRVFSAGDPPLTNKLVLAYRENSYLSTYAQDFIEIAKKCL
ncbi:MAG: LysR family transcriptional regulator [Lachnospiraceae bacterium]|nr:LysR family transcriptional regulator [Lachnospiraceae bacterium]